MAGDAFAANKQVKMAVFAVFGAVGMIIILPIGLVIINITFGIMIPFIKGAAVFNDLAFGSAPAF